MSDDYFSTLLRNLEDNAKHRSGRESFTTQIDHEDLIRLKALAEVYDIDIQDLCAALFHSMLQELEARMPYRPGTEIIRMEDGDPVYEDIGPMPRYLSIIRRLEAESSQANGDTKH